MVDDPSAGRRLDSASSEHGLFGEVVFSYSDADALRDGVLVDTSRFPAPGFGPIGNAVNRVTRAVWDAYVKPLGSSAVTGPVYDSTELMQIGERELAPRFREGKFEDGWLVFDWKGRRLWAIPNEVGAFSLLFPEDY